MERDGRLSQSLFPPGERTRLDVQTSCSVHEVHLTASGFRAFSTENWLYTFCVSKWRDGWWGVFLVSGQNFQAEETSLLEKYAGSINGSKGTWCFSDFSKIMSLVSQPDCVFAYFKMEGWCTTLLHTQLAVSTTAVCAALGISLGLSVCFQTCPQVWQRPWR